MTKFKVGDRVVHKVLGTEHTVEKANGGALIKIEGSWKFDTNFKLVEPTKPQDDLPPDWAIERARELYVTDDSINLWHAFARYIATKEQPPEPPEVVAARGHSKARPEQKSFLAGVKWAKENLL